MAYPDWAPIEIVSFIKEHEDRINSQLEWQSNEKEILQRDVDMWRRLVTRPEMEKIWRKIKGDDKNRGWITKVDSVVHVVSNIRKDYDNGVRLTVKDYETDLKDIVYLASLLSKKLHKFTVASEENNPFLYRLLLGNENLDLLSKVIKQKTYDPEFRDLWWCYRPEHYIDHVLPSIDKLLVLLSNAARVESEEKELRLSLPTKVGAESAFRTYFIKSIGRYLTRSWGQYSPSNIAAFCSVALDDAAINPDLVGALCPLTDELIPKPLTQAEILSMVEQAEALKRMMREFLHLPSPQED